MILRMLWLPEKWQIETSSERGIYENLGDC